MPVRSLSSSVLRWPDPDDVRRSAKAWAQERLAADAGIRCVGYFGSYARGDAGVGSDLDLIVVVERASEPSVRRGLAFDTSSLPVPVDLIVYSEEEFTSLLAGGGRFASELQEHAVWFSR